MKSTKTPANKYNKTNKQKTNAKTKNDTTNHQIKNTILQNKSTVCENSRQPYV